MKEKLKSALRRVSAFVMTSAPVLAMAQATDPFETVVDTTTTNITSWGGMLVLLAGVGVGFAIMIKYIRKIRGAA